MSTYFSTPPIPTRLATATNLLRGDVVPSPTGYRDVLEEFQKVYVMERRYYDKLQGSLVVYRPSASWAGERKSSSIEDRDVINQWRKVYQVLHDHPVGGLEPSRYVRVLFSALRGSSISVPTPPQLTSVLMRELVLDHLDVSAGRIREQFVSESDRAVREIRIACRLHDETLPLAVYRAILDPRLGLSSLFCYCLLKATESDIRRQPDTQAWQDRLESLAQDRKLSAVMEYTVFADTFDSVWGTMIPQGFRSEADSILSQEIWQTQI